jgi:hypothetical protein
MIITMSYPARSVANHMKWNNENAAAVLAANGHAVGASYQTTPDGGWQYDGVVVTPSTPEDTAYARFRAVALADQAITLNIEQSFDGTNWFTTATESQAIANFGNQNGSTPPTGTVTPLESLVVAPYVRASWTNQSGSTATTRCSVFTALVGV